MRWANREMNGRKEWRCSKCDVWYEGVAVIMGEVICFNCLGNRVPTGYLGKAMDTVKQEPATVDIQIEPYELLIIEAALFRYGGFHDSLYMKVTSTLSVPADATEKSGISGKVRDACDALRKEGAFEERASRR